MAKIVFIFCCLFGNSALAGTAQGVITKLHSGPAYGSLFFVTLSASATGIPPCKTNNAFQFVFDSATPAGRNTLAILMLAHAAGNKLTISGEGRCSLYGDTEDLRWVLLD